MTTINDIRPFEEMSLRHLFDSFIPRLYPGIRYKDPKVRQKTLTPEGGEELLTWHQACARELRRWGFSDATARNIVAQALSSKKRKREPQQMREKACFMWAKYKEIYGEI